jgi:DNA-binding transcriptional LysR family regulator
MARTNMNELAAFVAVGRARSFSRAAAQLGVSPSALSHTLRGLEARVGLRLLNRTTRSVTPTEAGERLLGAIGPMLDEIDVQVAGLSDLREKPSGAVRINADEHAVEAVLWPVLRRVLADYPDIHVELVTDYGLSDIVAERCDAGVRLGDAIAKDMIAVPIGPEMSMAVVASPAYLARHPPPQSPDDLTTHDCINIRLPTHGGLYAWEFEQDGRDLRVHVEGQLVFNSIRPALQACLDGFGLAYLAAPQVKPHLETGALVRVLSAYTPNFAGYHIYYPSRRQPTSAFTVLVDALRFRQGDRARGAP